MNAPIMDQLLKAVDVEANLVPYLKFSGWEMVDALNRHWIVMHGEQDADNEPFEIVFPREKSTEKRIAYVSKAVELLGALKSEPVQLVAQRIINYDRDMLYIRNTETEDENAIALNLAVAQIRNLKKTIEYSACSEREARPFFATPLSIAHWATQEYLFGHTFAGSFGFTVEAPRLPDPPQFIQQRLDLGDNFPETSTYTPLERRVMERIARGLITAKKAEESRDYSLLLKDYTGGFNSNMCTSVVGISPEKRSTIEFRIAWSPKIKPPDDVVQIPSIRLRQDGYENLEYAAKELKTIKPEIVTITGKVRALTSSDNPLSSGTHRAIIIRGYYADLKRPIDILVELDRDDYEKANKAHIEWLTVEVNGILVRSGATWRLSKAKDFKAKDSEW